MTQGPEAQEEPMVGPVGDVRGDLWVTVSTSGIYPPVNPLIMKGEVDGG